MEAQAVLESLGGIGLFLLAVLLDLFLVGRLVFSLVIGQLVVILVASDVARAIVAAGAAGFLVGVFFRIDTEVARQELLRRAHGNGEACDVLDLGDGFALVVQQVEGDLGRRMHRDGGETASGRPGLKGTQQL